MQITGFAPSPNHLVSHFFSPLHVQKWQMHGDLVTRWTPSVLWSDHNVYLAGITSKHLEGNISSHWFWSQSNHTVLIIPSMCRHIWLELQHLYCTTQTERKLCCMSRKPDKRTVTMKQNQAKQTIGMGQNQTKRAKTQRSRYMLPLTTGLGSDDLTESG